MKDYSNCTPREFKLMVLAQLELAENHSVLSRCEPYFRRVLEEVNETIGCYLGLISQFEEQSDKVRDYLKSNSKPRNSLKLNGLTMLDKTACDWAKNADTKLKQIRKELRCYEEVHEMLMLRGI
ncbi:hypothetical protein ACPV5U_18520 [Vibrio mediterranei]